MRRADSLEKTLMLGKIEGRGKRGQPRMRWLDGITDSSLSTPILLSFVYIYLILRSFSSVQLFSHVLLSATPWTAARQASLSVTNSQSLLKLMSTESAIKPSYPLLPPSPPLLLPPSIFPSITVFSNESILCIR